MNDGGFSCQAIPPSLSLTGARAEYYRSYFTPRKVERDDELVVFVASMLLRGTLPTRVHKKCTNELQAVPARTEWLLSDQIVWPFYPIANNSSDMMSKRPAALSIESEDDEDVVIRVALIGDSGVGKSAVVSHLCADISDRGGLYTPTVGCDVEVLAIQNEEDPNETFYVELWDIGGNPHYEAARGSLYAECDGFIFVWDADAVHTFHSLENWLSEVLRNKGNLLDDEEAGESGGLNSRNDNNSDSIDVEVDLETGMVAHAPDRDSGTGSRDTEDGESDDTMSHLQSFRQSGKDDRVRDRRVRNAPRSSSRRYSSGNRLTSAKYSSGTLDSIMNSQRSSVPYGRRDQGDIFGGSSSIINSLINRKRHTTNPPPRIRNVQTGEEGGASGGPLAFLTSIFTGRHDGFRSTDAAEKQKADHDVAAGDGVPRRGGAASPSLPSSSIQGNRRRGDSLVVHYGIQSPEKTSSADGPAIVREGIEDESDTDLDVEAGGRAQGDEGKGAGVEGQNKETQAATIKASERNEATSSPVMPTGLSRRRAPQQPAQEKPQRRGSTGNRSRGFSFPHGGLPLMIVANKVDKVGQRDLRSLRSTCSNHVFTSATFESYMDEKPFYNFFHEIKRVYSHSTV